MTRLQRRNHGKGHSYRLDGHKILGVTTITDTLPKPALVNWAGRQSAQNAVDHWDELAQLPVSERLDRIQWAHRDTKQAAALRGSQIHALGEKLAHGEQVDVPPEHVGPVEAYARWLDAWQVETIASETPVANTRYRFGGTADLWGKVGKLDGARCLLDVKTGNGVFEGAALQLTAYRFCDLWHPYTPTAAERRKGAEPVEEPLPEVDAVYVAHVKADTVDMLPIQADDGMFREFLYLMQTRRWLDACRDEPPVGQPIYPEDEQ